MGALGRGRKGQGPCEETANCREAFVGAKTTWERYGILIALYIGNAPYK